MPKGKRTNEPVKVVAHSVRYGVQDERLYTSISGFEIRQQDEPPALTDSFITVEFGPTVSKTSAITALRMVLEKEPGSLDLLNPAISLIATTSFSGRIWFTRVGEIALSQTGLDDCRSDRR
jgi:hypothetical protein